MTPVVPDKDWPEGISDGLVTPCRDCGTVPSFDYTVNNREWMRLTRSYRGVICLPCLDRIGTKVGIDISESLTRVQWTGIGKTVVLEPHFTHRYVSKTVTPAVPALIAEWRKWREDGTMCAKSEALGGYKHRDDLGDAIATALAAQPEPLIKPLTPDKPSNTTADPGPEC